MRYGFYVINAFSANMLADVADVANVSFAPISREYAASMLRDHLPISAVGHEDTASVFSAELGEKVEFRRETVNLSKGGYALLGQYSGPRLPEWATSLPEGAKIKWFRVSVSVPEPEDDYLQQQEDD